MTSQPADSTLSLSAHASNSPASVHLHPAFEGAFELATANGPVVFDVDMKVEDPARRGRGRMWVISERTMRAWRGLVAWGPPDDGRTLRGRVVVETVNGVVELKA